MTEKPKKSRGTIVFFGSYMDKKYFGSVSSRNRGGFGAAQLFAGIRYGPPFENRWDGHSYVGWVGVLTIAIPGNKNAVLLVS